MSFDVRNQKSNPVGDKETADFVVKLSDQCLLAAYRISKTRLRPFFAKPRAMVALRNEIVSRNLRLK